MAEAYRHDEIARFAYELWERRGRPLGSPEIGLVRGGKCIGCPGFARAVLALQSQRGARRRSLSQTLSSAWLHRKDSSRTRTSTR
jgi:hypothetical protein